MPRLYFNIESDLLNEINTTLADSTHADFCVGYFNLRGWRLVDNNVEKWTGGEGNQCRLMVGMQRRAEDELRLMLSPPEEDALIDNKTLAKEKLAMAERFREQLTVGIPTNTDEAGLRRLVSQLEAGKLVVKLYLAYPLHAKMYLCHRSDKIIPKVGYLGSSNLTFAGLKSQGELNIDVVDRDMTEKLAEWFNERWNNRSCIDITKELIEVIKTSWAREDLIKPYHIYIKMAWHLAQEARAGLSGFAIPKDFGNQMFDYQVAAVKIAAHHVNKRSGVLIGDVVGLGKTLMATALARVFQDDHNTETLIICPKNLVSMWEDYVHKYRMVAKVLSLSKVCKELPDLHRYRMVLIDESHNLRNPDGSRYRAIREYIMKNDSRCILLTATPYNKSYVDLSSQLKLFVPEDQDLGIRPEHLLEDIGETEFIRKHQCGLRTLAAFEKSSHPDDWRELMRLYMVRRTRSFIKSNYAKDEGGRKYLLFEDGSKSYFPVRKPKTMKFVIDEQDAGDQYARLFSEPVVDAVNALKLPRYGLGNYIDSKPQTPPSEKEKKELGNLSRAGKRLMGFCRTNLFKRLESSGQAFILSVYRHILRNEVYCYAIDNGLPIPIGTQDTGLLEPVNEDRDLFSTDEDDEMADSSPEQGDVTTAADDITAYKKMAKQVYDRYHSIAKNRFKWLAPSLFAAELLQDLQEDSARLIAVLKKCGPWAPEKDAKLDALLTLVKKTHKNEKVLVFSQFSDTVEYLGGQLRAAGVDRMLGVTGDTEEPTAAAWRFSPVSNDKRDLVTPEDELRVLIATDVLSEGQNLQDASIVVNYDLPWAIIRLIQRAGRVDRIGQQSPEIKCYSFLPADGVERLIKLHARVVQRLEENQEVVGADETFFSGKKGKTTLDGLYDEKAGILDDDQDSEVDLSSYAYQIWKNAVDRDPGLKKLIPEMPNVVFGTRKHEATKHRPHGALVYVRTGQGNDALAWVDAAGNPVTESQYEILRAAECTPEELALPRQEVHHELVKKAVEHLNREETMVGGQLGRPSGARFRAYERLKRYADSHRDQTLFGTAGLDRVIEEIYRYPLKETARDQLNRLLRSGATDEDLAALAASLHEEGKLCLIEETTELRDPQIVCSLGLV